MDTREAGDVTAAPAPSRRWWWSRRRWSELTQVERVELYVVQSLYAVLVGLMAVVVGSLLLRLPASSLGTGVTVTVTAVVLTALGVRALRGAIEVYPATGPLPWSRIGPILAAGVVAVVIALLLPSDPRNAVLLTVWGALAIALGGYADRRLTVVLVITLALVLGVPTRDVGATVYGLGVGAFLIFTVRASLWLNEVVRELDGTRGAQSALAVAEERLRFSRDVHDVLGRRLSEIAVQAELAARLAEAGDPSAPGRMEEVRGTAHAALREARELARGYRATDLDHELDGARSLLSAAGITTYVDLGALADAWREPVAWVVREAVTNVLRHSRATAVHLVWAGDRLSIVNDGAGPGPVRETRDGSGLAGLRERLRPLGADLVTRVEDGSFVLEMPVSTRTPGSSDVGAPA